jgi:hypothetical protein
MIINVREKPFSQDTASNFGKSVFVDGKLVNRVWYVDTERRIVKSYDVFGDGIAHTVNDEMVQNHSLAGLECLDNWVLSKTVSGSSICLESGTSQMMPEMQEYIVANT